VQVTPLSRSAPQSITGGLEGLLLGYAAYDRAATEGALRVLAQMVRAQMIREPITHKFTAAL
jgi:hypothetical protein